MDQQFSLSWNNFHGNLSKGFASLLGKAEFVDVTIAVEGHLLQAHKVILSICSPYFKKMFLLNPCQHPIVVLRDVTYKAMKDLLQFMYQGEVSVKREDLNSFIGTAELLQIKGLTNKQGDEYSENEHEIIENASKKDTETNHIHKISKSHETSQNEINLKRHCEIIQRLHKFTSLKRKSEEFLQKNYFSTDIFINADKRQKLKEQYSKTSDNAVSSNSFESYHNIYNDNPIDTAINYTNKSDHNSLTHGKVTPNSRPEDSDGPDTNIDIKPECEDDIIVTEPDACITPKNFDSRLKDGDFPLTQESVPISANASPENQSLPVRYKYIYSRKGHKQLVHMNFVYTKHSTSHGKTSWRCVQYFSLNRCPATVETIDEMIFAVNHQHNHEDSFEKLSKDNVYEMH